MKAIETYLNVMRKLLQTFAALHSESQQIEDDIEKIREIDKQERDKKLNQVLESATGRKPRPPRKSG